MRDDSLAKLVDRDPIEPEVTWRAHQRAVAFEVGEEVAQRRVVRANFLGQLGECRGLEAGCHRGGAKVRSDQFLLLVEDRLVLAQCDELGPGRHPISSCYFWYFKNPCGGAAEYDFDSDVMTDDWQPEDWESIPASFAEWTLAEGIQRYETIQTGKV